MRNEPATILGLAIVDEDRFDLLRPRIRRLFSEFPTPLACSKPEIWNTLTDEQADLLMARLRNKLRLDTERVYRPEHTEAADTMPVARMDDHLAARFQQLERREP